MNFEHGKVDGLKWRGRSRGEGELGGGGEEGRGEGERDVRVGGLQVEISCSLEYISC